MLNSILPNRHGHPRLRLLAAAALLAASGSVFAQGPIPEIRLDAPQDPRGGDMITLTTTLRGDALLYWSQNEAPNYSGKTEAALTVYQGDVAIARHKIESAPDVTVVRYLPCQTPGQCPNGSVKTTLYYKRNPSFTVNVRLPEGLGQTPFKSTYYEYDKWLPINTTSPVLLIDHSKAYDLTPITMYILN